MKSKLMLLFLLLWSYIAEAQEKTQTTVMPGPSDGGGIIPDKVLETGIPLLFLFFVLNTLVSYSKSRAENRLKLKMIDKGISEEALIKIFSDGNKILRLQPIKWFLFSLATGLALMAIYLSGNMVEDSSGFFALSIIVLFNAFASYGYYLILSRKK